MRHPGIERWYFFFMQFLSILSQFGKGKLHIFVTCVGSMYTIYLNLHLNHDSIAETVILKQPEICVNNTAYSKEKLPPKTDKHDKEKRELIGKKYN